MTSTIQRRKKGRVFRYVKDSGEQLSPRQLERVKSLAIPPAWKDVKIAGSPNAKVQATGYDVAGRKQYLYHPTFRQQQEQKKFDRLLAFANALPMMRAVTAEHLKLSGHQKEKVLACMVRLIDQAYFRVGNDRYAAENSTYGLSTLRSKHLSIEGNTMIFDFIGKSHQRQYREVTDARLAKIVQELDDLPGYEVFKYKDDSGNLIDVKSQDVNAYIKQVMGYDFSAKDFRTWAGTLVAAVALAEAEQKLSASRAKKEVTRAINQVAKKLGNTPAIARASYVDPRVIDHYLAGSTIKWYLARINSLLQNEPQQLSHEEMAVLKLLRKRLKTTAAARP